jgi:hypothetical protein
MIYLIDSTSIWSLYILCEQIEDFEVTPNDLKIQRAFYLFVALVYLSGYLFKDGFGV